MSSRLLTRIFRDTGGGGFALKNAATTAHRSPLRASLKRRVSYNADDAYEQSRIDFLLSQELRVETLNQLFAPDSIRRQQAYHAPGSAFGAVFELEGTVVDMSSLKRALWSHTALELDLPLPDASVLAKTVGMRPQDVALR